MMDTPKIFVLVKFKDPIWSGLGPVQTGAIMSTSQGDFRSRYAGGQISLINFSTAGSAGLAALKQKLVHPNLRGEKRIPRGTVVAFPETDS